MKKIHRTIIHSACTACVCAAFMLTATSCTIKQVQKINRTVSVSGTGVVWVTPDRATVTLSVETYNKNVSAAAEENAAKMTQVQTALLSSGIPQDDISTANYNLYQDTSWNNGKKIIGDYHVSNEITAVIRKIDTLGSVIDAAITAGANQLNSITFGISDTQNSEKQARILAIKDAENTAKLLALTSGADLGKVQTITEDPGSLRAPQFPAANLMAKSAASDVQTPITPGKSKISVTVHAVYALQ